MHSQIQNNLIFMTEKKGVFHQLDLLRSQLDSLSEH